jgi:hypothetical protein
MAAPNCLHNEQFQKTTMASINQNKRKLGTISGHYQVAATKLVLSKENQLFYGEQTLQLHC